MCHTEIARRTQGSTWHNRHALGPRAHPESKFMVHWWGFTVLPVDIGCKQKFLKRQPDFKILRTHIIKLPNSRLVPSWNPELANRIGGFDEGMDVHIRVAAKFWPGFKVNAVKEKTCPSSNKSPVGSWLILQIEGIKKTCTAFMKEWKTARPIKESDPCTTARPVICKNTPNQSR